MQRIIVTLFAILVVSSHARAQTSTSRVWKLCVMEDPKCIEEIRDAYYLASQTMLNDPGLKKYVCVKSEVPDVFLYKRFMQIVGTNPARFSNLPMVETEKYLLTFGSQCDNGTIVPKGAAINGK